MNQQKTTDVGPVGLIPSGAYNPAATYSLLMTVLYDHDSWVCIAMDAEGNEKEITGIAPDDPEHGAENWQALTDGGRAAVAEAAQMRTEFNTWFGATAAAGIRKTVDDWIAQKQAQFNTWFGTDANSGVRKTFNDFMTLAQNTFRTWFGADDTEGVQKEWKDLKSEATSATNSANNAAELCEAWNTHPPYIGDGKTGDLNYWYIYDITAEQYVKGPYAKGDDLDWDSMPQADKDRLAQLVLEHIAFDNVPMENSDHAVKSSGIKAALDKKQDVLDFATEAECRAIVTMYGQASSSSDDSSSSSDEPSDSSDSSDDSSGSSDSSDDSTSSEDSSSSSDEPSSSSDSE